MIAIRFAEWILHSGYSPVGAYKNEMKWGSGRISSELYTTIQLYSLYLESKSHEVAESDT